jgi:predicted ArsR family transcriptional regulator
MLVEHHCPICAAAQACQGFCRNELELFRRVLGPGVTVDRTEYLLGGDQRCAYRITRD